MFHQEFFSHFHKFRIAFSNVDTYQRFITFLQLLWNLIIILMLWTVLKTFLKNSLETFPIILNDFWRRFKPVLYNFWCIDDISCQHDDWTNWCSSTYIRLLLILLFIVLDFFLYFFFLTSVSKNPLISCDGFEIKDEWNIWSSFYTFIGYNSLRANSRHKKTIEEKKHVLKYYESFYHSVCHSMEADIIGGCTRVTFFFCNLFDMAFTNWSFVLKIT